MQDSSASEEIRSIDKKPGGMWNVLQESLDDYIAEEKKSRSDCINGVLPKLNCKKKKKLFITEEKKSRSDCINGVPPKLNCKKKKKLPTYEEEEPRVFMMVKKVLVGDLICEPREPVEVGVAGLLVMMLVILVMLMMVIVMVMMVIVMVMMVIVMIAMVMMMLWLWLL